MPTFGAYTAAVYLLVFTFLMPISVLCYLSVRDYLVIPAKKAWADAVLAIQELNREIYREEMGHDMYTPKHSLEHVH